MISPVVDHLLIPCTLMQCPHNDQAALIAAGQLVVRAVPYHVCDCGVVALQVLVEGQRPPAATSATTCCYRASCCCCCSCLDLGIAMLWGAF